VLALSGCGREQGNDASAATDANLLDAATVNAILGAGISAEDLPQANIAEENRAENAAGNETD